MPNNAIIRKAAEICRFVMELNQNDPDGYVVMEAQHLFENDNHFLESWDFTYAEAILNWESHGKNPASFFSSDNPILIHYRKQLSSKFGLEVLNPKEAEERQKQQPVQTVMVDGFGNGKEVSMEQANAQRNLTTSWWNSFQNQPRSNNPLDWN